MNLFLALLAALFGLWISPGHSIGDIPFSQLTLKMVIGTLFELGAYIGAFSLFIKSLEHDRIWPWRWTWPYFGNLVVRTSLLAFIVWSAVWLIENKNAEGFKFITVVVFALVAVLWALFSPELDLFSEKKTDEEKSDSEMP